MVLRKGDLARDILDTGKAVNTDVNQALVNQGRGVNAALDDAGRSIKLFFKRR